MITLSLLHPLKTIPIQHWTFPPESTIRVGRSADNDVIIYSAVVSRHHLEIRHNGSSWELTSMGSNGTYVKGKRIGKIPAIDGMVVRLASSGPQIQIRLDSQDSKTEVEISDSNLLSSPPLEKQHISKETLIG